MKIEEKLEIILITYNRKKNLQKTLSMILNEDSPVQKCKITVLDNASTDGSSEMLSEYCANYNNLNHIRRNKNVGADANTCRAYEIAEKEYAWVLCDDDKYDWTDWKLVEKHIEKKAPCICVSHSGTDITSDLSNPAILIREMTYTPSCIFRTDLVSDTIISNMYATSYTLFPQLILPIWCINNNFKIPFVKNRIVIDWRDNDTNCSFYRGAERKDVFPRRKFTNFYTGYASILHYVINEKIRWEAFKTEIKKTMSDDDFYLWIYKYSKETNIWNFLGEVFTIMPENQRTKLIDVICKENNNGKFQDIKNYIQIYRIKNIERKKVFINIFDKLKIRIFSKKRKK